ncbi:MAG: hypothetical protein JNK74_01645 [Candidatus Hydrogenedentes bacterium]|nr:hypothetical protein [Candidatus Hydrogenedentota bacterium]
MKKSPHVVDELSAYIDGESRDPEYIARHLQSCPECARHHLQLLKLSGHLKALEAPETHPAFVTRVMAHTAEVPRARVWFPAFAPRWAAALCLIGLAAAGGWRWLPESAPRAQTPTAAQRVNIAWQDDAQVVEALGRLMDAGIPVDVFGDLDETAEGEEPDVALDSVLEALADASSEADFVDPFAHHDLDGMMDAFEGEDVELLDNLLATAGNEV